MNVRRIFKLSGVVALAVVVLGGCRAEEQGRLINYEPGVYKGKPDDQLNDQQVRALRQRSAYQGSSVALSGGGSPAKSRDVRKPSSSPVDLGKLNNRTRMQAGSSTRL